MTIQSKYIIKNLIKYVNEVILFKETKLFKMINKSYMKSPEKTQRKKNIYNNIRNQRKRLHENKFCHKLVIISRPTSRKNSLEG